MKHEHEWHLASNFCIHCGLGREHELEPPYECHRESNVSSISHKVRPNVLRTPSKNINPTSK